MLNITVFCKQPDKTGYIDHALRVAEEALIRINLIEDAIFDVPEGHNPRRFRNKEAQAPYVRVLSNSEKELRLIVNTMYAIDPGLNIEIGTLDGFIEGIPPQAT